MHQLQPEQGALWHQQVGETQKAYAAFCLYRDMNPSERTARKVADLLGVHENGIYKWSTEFNWKERVAAYDHFNANYAITLRKMELEEYQKSVLEKETTLTTMMFEIMGSMWSDLHKQTVQAREGLEDENGERVKMPTGRDIISLVNASEKLSLMIRRTANLPTTYTSAAGDPVDEEQQVFYIGDD